MLLNHVWIRWRFHSIIHLRIVRRWLNFRFLLVIWLHLQINIFKFCWRLHCWIVWGVIDSTRNWLNTMRKWLTFNSFDQWINTNEIIDVTGKPNSSKQKHFYFVFKVHSICSKKYQQRSKNTEDQSNNAENPIRFHSLIVALQFKKNYSLLNFQALNVKLTSLRPWMNSQTMYERKTKIPIMTMLSIAVIGSENGQV